MPQLLELRELEQIKRILDPNLLEGRKGEKPLPGILGIEINLSQMKKLVAIFGERLSGKKTELELEAKGIKMKFRVGNQTELSAAMQDVEQFIKSVSEK